MSAAPLVSVIVPAFNAERFVRETISSVVNQTFSDWELIVGDDLSTDRTAEIVEAMGASDPRVRVVRGTRNRGCGAARNLALRAARGRYVAFLDADDLWDRDKLEKQVGFMQRGGHAFTYTGYRVIAEDGRVLGSTGPVAPSKNYAELAVDYPGVLTVVLDREQLGPVEFPEIRRHEDGALWLAILRKVPRAFGVTEDLASYRAVRVSLSANKLKQAHAVWTVFRGQERLPLLTTALYFSGYAVRGLRKHLATRARQ